MKPLSTNYFASNLLKTDYQDLPRQFLATPVLSLIQDDCIKALKGLGLELRVQLEKLQVNIVRNRETAATRSERCPQGLVQLQLSPVLAIQARTCGGTENFQQL